jgi:hypothetical protein
MSLPFSQWRTMPASAALAIMLWAVSWIWFLIHYYVSTQDDTYAVRIAAGIVLLSIFIVRINNWARMIALMVNAMAIFFLAIWAFASFQADKSAAFVIELANLVAFFAASYYLFTSSTSRFFKTHSHSGGKNTDPS